MKVLANKSELEAYITEKKNAGLTIGFAPTMGALHQGHLSLYQYAREENDIVVSSIFVNPTQFNNAEDLEKYPRTIDKDIELLTENGNVDVVYLPKIEDIYPSEVVSKTYDFEGLDKEMEGASRAGHFDGVGTVVEELFRQVRPNNAYFGEKDFQQLVIIKKLVEKLDLPITIKGIPIVRAENGLAMSSRNQRLTEDRREEASLIYQSLLMANDLYKEGKTPAEIKLLVQHRYEELPDYDLEYISIADEGSLKEVVHFENDNKYRAFIVVWVDGVRLIDNLHLG